MNYFFYNSIFKVFQQGIPGLLVLILLLFSVMPFSIFGIGSVLPPFALIGIFYWGIYRPDLLPKIMIFIFGFLQDIMSGGPLGLWSLIFLIFHLVVENQRDFFIGKKFIIEWLSFIFIIPLVYIPVLFINLIFYERFPEFFSIYFQVIILISLYPIISSLMGKLRKFIGGF